MTLEKPSESDISIIIPVKNGNYPDITLESLERQTYKNFDCYVIKDKEEKGANYCRNRGFRDYCRTDFVLFSDDDIKWEPDALQILRDCLIANPKCSYSYGYYTMNGKTFCDKPFNPFTLLTNNYISTMSLIRSDHFVYFDESLKRLQDWDLWLTMLLTYKRYGVYCGRKIFTTELKSDGISGKNSVMSYNEAERIIKEKHKI